MGLMVMVMNLYRAFSINIYSNVLYKQGIYGWDQTSAYIGAAGSRYQSISDLELTQQMNEWNGLLCGVSLAQNESTQNVPRAVLKLLFRPNKNTESILNMHKSWP